MALPLHHPIPAVGVGAVLLDNQENVLLIKRAKEPAKHLWSIPGGKLEPGETMTEACQREFLEETGLVIKVGPIIGVVERITPEFHYIIMDFAATLTQQSSSAPQASSDVDDARWVPVSGLPSYELVEGLLPIIKCAGTVIQNESGNGLFDIQGNGSDFLPVGSHHHP